MTHKLEDTPVGMRMKKTVNIAFYILYTVEHFGHAVPMHLAIQILIHMTNAAWALGPDSSFAYPQIDNIYDIVGHPPVIHATYECCLFLNILRLSGH